MKPVGKALGVADEAGATLVFADADKQAFAGGPGAGDGVRLHMRQELLVHALSGSPERKLPQRRQIAGRKIMRKRPLGLVRHIDLAFLQALDQLARRKVHDLDVVRFVEDRNPAPFRGRGCE